MKRGPERRDIMETIIFLEKSARKNKAKIWKSLARALMVPRRRKIAVNLSKISKLTKPGDVVAVPGKVLGGGQLEHPVKIACFSTSQRAKEKVERKGGKILAFKELVEENPKGSGVMILR